MGEIIFLCQIEELDADEELVIGEVIKELLGMDKFGGNQIQLSEVGMEVQHFQIILCIYQIFCIKLVYFIKMGASIIAQNSHKLPQCWITLSHSKISSIFCALLQTLLFSNKYSAYPFFIYFTFSLCRLNIKQNMIEGATFSMEQSQRILQIYIKAFDIQKVYKEFKRRDQRHLREHLKRIIRETVISIEANMYTAKKIKSLTLFDNQSNEMFEAFMNLEEIIPESEKQNFLMNFRKMKEQGCRMFRKGRTEFYVEISTEERERLYEKFVKYCQEKDLYRFCITTTDHVTDQTPPYSQAGRIYPQRDLELVYKAYSKTKGDYKQMENFFKTKNIFDAEFFGQKLEDNIYNLKLIGNFVVYKKSAQAGSYQGIKWLQFRDRYPVSEDWDYKIQVVLLRIGIREDPSKDEIKYITRMQSRKYIERNAPANAFNEQDYWKMYFDGVISKIKGEMKKVVIVQKNPPKSEKPPLFERKDPLLYQGTANYAQMLRPLEKRVKMQSGHGKDIDYSGMFNLWRQERAMDRFTMQKKLFEIAQRHINSARNPEKRQAQRS